jgi:hypothetical protein
LALQAEFDVWEQLSDEALLEIEEGLKLRQDGVDTPPLERSDVDHKAPGVERCRGLCLTAALERHTMVIPKIADYRR